MTLAAAVHPNAHAIAVLDARWRTPWDGEGPANLPHADDGAALVAAMRDGDELRCAPRGQPCARRASRFIEPIASFAVACGVELARAHALGDSDRLGLYAGSGGLRGSWGDLWAPMQHQRRDARGSWELGLGRTHPLWMLRFLSNNAHGLLAAELGARGEGAVCTGPAGGAEALMMAQAALLDHAIDRALVLCYDARSGPEVTIDRQRAGDRRLGVDCAVALLLARAEDAPRAPRVWTTTERSAAGDDGQEPLAGAPRRDRHDDHDDHDGHDGHDGVASRDAHDASSSDGAGHASTARRAVRSRDDIEVLDAPACGPADRFAGVDAGAAAPALLLALAAAGKRWQPADARAADAELCYTASMGFRSRLRVRGPEGAEADARRSAP